MKKVNDSDPALFGWTLSFPSPASNPGGRRYDVRVSNNGATCVLLGSFDKSVPRHKAIGILACAAAEFDVYPVQESESCE